MRHDPASGAIVIMLRSLDPPAGHGSSTDYLYQPARPLNRMTLADFKDHFSRQGDDPTTEAIDSLDPLVSRYQERLKALLAGDATGSLVLARIRSGEMPPTGPGLKPAEVDLLERFVAGGAPTARPEPESIPPGLGITPEERARFADQLSGVLEHFAALQALDTSGVSPTAQVQDLRNVMRDDVARPSTPRDAILLNAPRQEDGFFRVQAVLDA